MYDPDKQQPRSTRLRFLQSRPSLEDDERVLNARGLLIAFGISLGLWAIIIGGVVWLRM